MAVKDTANWLIAYDIRSPQRLRKVHRYLSGEAFHLQYSVFLTRGTLQRMGTLRKALEDLIDHREDDVRIYRIPDSPLIHTIGAQGLPELSLVLNEAVEGAAMPGTERPKKTQVKPPPSTKT